MFRLPPPSHLHCSHFPHLTGSGGGGTRRERKRRIACCQDGRRKGKLEIAFPSLASSSSFLLFLAACWQDFFFTSLHTFLFFPFLFFGRVHPMLRSSQPGRSRPNQKWVTSYSRKNLNRNNVSLSLPSHSIISLIK